MDSVEKLVGFSLPQMADIRPRRFEASLSFGMSETLRGQSRTQRLVLLPQFFPVIFYPGPIRVAKLTEQIGHGSRQRDVLRTGLTQLLLGEECSLAPIGFVDCIRCGSVLQQ